MPATKKQLEILLMSYFRECYSGFPKGKVIPSESPDFIVSENRKKTGIELTRLNPVNKKNPGKEKEKNNELIERIIDSAKNLFDPTSPFRLFVKFLFSEKYHVKPGRELSLTVKLANSVRQTVKNNNPEFFFEEHHLIYSLAFLKTSNLQIHYQLDYNRLQVLYLKNGLREVSHFLV